MEVESSASSKCRGNGGLLPVIRDPIRIYMYQVQKVIGRK